ncbi:MAG: polysaccharide deacetylase family protein [Gammaproteobacteria bacterium]
MRRLIKTGAASAMYWTGIAGLMGKISKTDATPLILGYHRVVENYDICVINSIAPMLISTRTLEQHLDWVGRHYRFVDLDDIIQNSHDKGSTEKPMAAITFDDGYADVYQNAFPLLKRKGIPFAVFAVTDLVGTNRLQLHDELYLLLSRAFFVWPSPRKHLRKLLSQIDVLPGYIGGLNELTVSPFRTTRAFLHSLPQEKIIAILKLLRQYGELQDADTKDFRSVDWEMLSEMRKAGVVIGSHTRSHAFLTNESKRKVEDEVRGSKQKLELMLGGEIRHLAYPDGRFSNSIVKAAAAAGYVGGYTTCQHRDIRHPGLTFPRRVLWEESCMDVFHRSSPAIMGCQVNGVFDFTGGCNISHQS